jgi:hypothetical protein
MARGGPLIRYEIRILQTDGFTDSVRLFHFSNDAAVQDARHFADGKHFEVWRGSERIFRRAPDEAPSPQVMSAANPTTGAERLIVAMELREQLLMAVR